MSLTITIGCPGAGKSTWADANLSHDTLRLERDRFREAIFGSRQAYHESLIDRRDRSRVITEAMGAAMTNWPHRKYAVTDTGLDEPAVRPFMDYALWVGAPIKLVVFYCGWDMLVARNSTRPEAHRIPHDILEERFQAFENPEAWWRHCDYEREYA